MAGSKVVPSEKSRVLNCSQRLRRKSEHLPSLNIPNDNHKNPFFKNLGSRQTTKEETIEEGKFLVKTFVEEEIRREHLETPDVIREQLSAISSNHKGAWNRAGQELRKYADDFMKSKERQKVREKAEEICRVQGHVTKEEFRDLLSGLLGDGITKERIVVLFFFCADVAIATLKQNVQELCLQFLEWSMQFIVEKVCSWVQEHGGWGSLYSSSLQMVGKAAIIVCLFSAGFILYKKITK